MSTAARAEIKESNPNLLHRAFLPVETVLDQPIKAFMRLRLIARSAYENDSLHYTLLHYAERAKSHLKKGQFNAHRIALLEDQIAAIQEARKPILELMQRVGALLLELAPKIDKVTTLEQRLELLNCNRADRSKVNRTEVGMRHLMGAYRAEDSADNRNDFRSNRPLHTCITEEVERVMFETPAGRKASGEMFDGLFAPGGMFEKVPRLYRRADGTFLRQGPPLTVHDENGSRVVERKPS